MGKTKAKALGKKNPSALATNSSAGEVDTLFQASLLLNKALGVLELLHSMGSAGKENADVTYEWLRSDNLMNVVFDVLDRVQSAKALIDAFPAKEAKNA